MGLRIPKIIGGAHWLQMYLQSWKLSDYTGLEPHSSYAEQPTLSRFLLVPGLLVTTLVSMILTFYINNARKPDPNLYYYVSNYRPTVSVIVNLIAHTLAFAHVYVLTSMINFSTRLLLRQYAPSLDRVKWWKAISAGDLDASLPWRFLLPAAGFFALALLPATLWTGALTPTMLYINQDLNLTVQVPNYASDTDGTYWNQTWTPNTIHTVNYTSLGSFSYTPAFDRRISLLNNAANTVANQDLHISIGRDDRTRYVYNTSSFGVGASVGLLPLDFGDYFQQVQSYSYNETGYYTEVYCSSNDNANWTIMPMLSESSNESTKYLPNLYMCMGETSKGSADYYLQYGLSQDGDPYNHSIVAMNADANYATGNGSVVIATGTSGGKFSQLNHTQCNVTFTPALFNVSVNLTSKSINVYVLSATLGTIEDMDPTAQPNETFQIWNCDSLPDLTTVDVTDIHPSTNCGIVSTPGRYGMGNIATRALRQLVDLSTISGNLLQSDLGDMFLAANSSEQVYCTTNEMSNCSAYPLYPVEHAIRSILDDSLLAFSSAQLMIANATKPMNMTASVQVVQFGTPQYIYLLFAFNSLLILTFLHEMSRTRAWRHLPVFDYNDIKSVIAASSMGGTALADEIATRHTQTGTVWIADSKDIVAGAVHVQMRAQNDTGTPRLVLAEHGNIQRGSEKSPWLMKVQGSYSPQDCKTTMSVRERAMNDDESVSISASLLESGMAGAPRLSQAVDPVL
ncbi:hypothetical protein MMC34_007558 [Xylographa carneopallida]|nr:hypothetical protein [Xylographa carneopallida]